MKYQLLYEYRTGVNAHFAFKVVEFNSIQEAKAFRLPVLCSYKQIKDIETEEVIEEWGEIRGSLRV